MTEKPKVFVREATGLVKGFSSWQSFAFNFGGIVTVVGLSTLFVSFNFLPGANIVIALLIFLPILLSYFVVDTQLGVAMPRSGGDYVFSSRLLHPSIGLMASFMAVFLLVLNPAIFSDLIISSYVPGFLSAIGMSAQASAFAMLSTRIILDSILIAISFALIIIPIRHYAKLQTVLMILSIMGAILIPVALLALGHNGFVSAFNAKSNVNYSAVINQAISLGYKPTFSWLNTILAIPGLGFFLITNWPVAVGGELKNVRRSVPIGVIGAGMAAWFIFLVTAILYYNVLGNDFAASIAYLTVNSPAHVPFGGQTLLTSILQYIYGTNPVTFLIAISLIAAAFLVIPQSLIVATRHIFAWSFDNIAPRKLSEVSESLHTPVWIAIILWIISEFILFVELYASTAIGIYLNAAIAVPIAYAPSLFGAMLFTRRRKELFNTAPALTKYKFGPVYAITILGAIAGVGFLLIPAFAAAFPQVGSPVTPDNIAFLIGVFLFGLVVYYSAKFYRKRQGIDIDLAFRQIPPE
jgi:APA family basic amino acid/polyamine antiporter